MHPEQYFTGNTIESAWLHHDEACVMPNDNMNGQVIVIGDDDAANKVRAMSQKSMNNFINRVGGADLERHAFFTEEIVEHEMTPGAGALAQLTQRPDNTNCHQAQQFELVMRKLFG